MPKRPDLLESLSPDDPNYEVGKRFYLKARADSHGLVADGHAGQLSVSDFVEGCIKTFEQRAQAHAAIEEATPIPVRCRRLDQMAKRSISTFTKEVTSNSKGPRKAVAKAAIAHFSRRVHEISARSKQQILEKEWARGNTGGLQPNARPPGGFRRPFDAVAPHELRRGGILTELTKALEAYFKSCSRFRNVEWDRVHDLLGSACRNLYDSLATSYFGVDPAIDPQHLFEIDGELFGGCTLSDFEKAVTGIKIQAPSHWPPPQMWREGDSPQAIREWTQISRGLNKEIRLGPHLEGGWLNAWVSEGVKAWRPQFEGRFAESQVKANRERATEPLTPTEQPQPQAPDLNPESSGRHKVEILPSSRATRSRSPDLVTSRERLELLGVLSRELATLKPELMRFNTIDGIKNRHPEFILWQHIGDAELKELIDGEKFSPKGYAATLTLRGFGITSRETFKKDRLKLRMAAMPRVPK